ncbi:MAG: glycosyltransferase [Bacteroidota bacterium]
MIIETLFFWILAVTTIGVIFIQLLQWRGLRSTPGNKSDQIHSFSIIIAARNEEKNISRLLDSFSQLDYPKEKFEIIIVDDRSTDSTKLIAEKFTARLSNLKIISILKNETDMPHKKNALRAGIANARFDILAFTDADCVVPKQWLKKLSEQFTDDVGAVAGYSPFQLPDRNRLFPSFLRYEELKGSLYAAAAINNGTPYMCTGRNFAYRKKVYDEVGGFEKIKHSVSGDDDLFLQLVSRETSWKVRYMTDYDSYILTVPPTTVAAFVNQRTRHISASKYYDPKMKILLGLFHLHLLIFLVGLFVTPLWSIIFFLVRINADAVIIAQGKKILNEEFTVTEFFRNELLLICYTIVIGPMGFIKKYDWKGAAA